MLLLRMSRLYVGLGLGFVCLFIMCYSRPSALQKQLNRSRCRLRRQSHVLDGNTVSQKCDSDIAHYNFNMHQPIFVIFGRDVATGVC